MSSKHSNQQDPIIRVFMQMFMYLCKNRKYLAFMVYDGIQWDIHILPSDKELESCPLLNQPFNEAYASFSPDDKWIAYESVETGQSEIYVIPFTEPGGSRRQITFDGGSIPIWVQDELFYMKRNKIMAVEVTTNPTFEYGNPKPVYEGKCSSELGYKYDITSDGQQLLILKPYEQEETAQQLNIILNWFEEFDGSGAGGVIAGIPGSF